MDKQETFEFHMEMTAKNLWYFSMYHANKGYLGAFNLIFTMASAYLLVTTWAEQTTAYRMLLILCVTMFTVWQPGQLYLKAKRQSVMAVMKQPIQFTCSKELLCVKQGDQNQELTWDQVVKVVRTRQMLVVYMDRIHAFLISNESMGDQRDAFCQMLKETVPKERRKGI